MAPELILPVLFVDKTLPSHPTKESDVYAFAMVTMEVLRALSEHVQRLTTLLRASFAGVYRFHPVPLVPA